MSIDWRDYSGRDDPEQRYRCQSCGGRIRSRHGRPHSRCYDCGAANPHWRFLDDPRIVRGEGCWEWTGPHTRAGYARYGNAYAHRLAFAEAHGTEPGSLEVCHHCDNPGCINPEHLFLGTHADNMGDAWRKGRVYISKGMRRSEWTHCKRGHEFTEENTYRYPNGTRACRICRREKMRQWEEAHRGKV